MDKDPIDQGCGQCQADPGDPCRTPSGDTKDDFHQARYTEWPDYPCPYCGAEPNEPCVTNGFEKYLDSEYKRYPHSKRESEFSIAAQENKLAKYGASPGEGNQMTERAKDFQDALDQAIFTSFHSFDEDAEYNPDNRYRYDPPEDRMIPDGRYITVLKTPPVNDFDWLEIGMTFWATHAPDTDDAGFNSKGYYKVVAHTPEGEVHLWPDEYCVLDHDDLVEFFDQDELLFHPSEYDAGDFNEDIFYLKSRGVSTRTAMAMVIGSVEKNIGWFEPREEIQEALKKLKDHVNENTLFGIPA